MSVDTREIRKAAPGTGLGKCQCERCRMLLIAADEIDELRTRLDSCAHELSLLTLHGEHVTAQLDTERAAHAATKRCLFQMQEAAKDIGSKLDAERAAHAATKRELELSQAAHDAECIVHRATKRELEETKARLVTVLQTDANQAWVAECAAHNDTRARLQSAEAALQQCKGYKHRYSVKSTISELVDDIVDAHFAKHGGGND